MKISLEFKSALISGGPCQRQAKCKNSKAPLHPLPIIGKPFSRLAFDLVGPYPKTKRNNRYILTCICYFSHYPEAIPLMEVDGLSVASAMLEVFSRTGLPQEILTDQGSVFVSKLTRQLCNMLNISPIKTSPYHPLTDGLLERWHGDLLAMLKKASDQKRDWDLYLPFVLFAYHQTPHSITGYSPFQLIYGVNVRGPLEVLRDHWIDGNCAATQSLMCVTVLSMAKYRITHNGATKNVRCHQALSSLVVGMSHLKPP